MIQRDKFATVGSIGCTFHIYSDRKNTAANKYYY